jgi:hypothetical protein
MDVECTICHKRYKNIDALGRHRNKCILKNPSHDIIVKETENMPYTRKLLTALLERVSKLEKKVDTNSKYITRERRKINIIDYLNDGEKAMLATTANASTHPTFNQFKLNIDINKQTVKEYLHGNSIIGLVNIVKMNLDMYEDSSVPIRCFGQKRSMYVRNIRDAQPRANDDVCLYYWVELSEWTEYERLIIHIQQKLLKEYEKTHNNKLCKTSTNTMECSQSCHTQDKYFENIKKILMTDISSETVCSRFKQQLYEALKREVEVKYEIVY